MLLWLSLLFVVVVCRCCLLFAVVVIVVVDVVVVVVLDTSSRSLDVYVIKRLRIHCAGALDGKELLTIEDSETWRSTPDDLEEREKWSKKDKKLLIAAIPTLKTYPSLCELGCPLTPAIN